MNYKNTFNLAICLAIVAMLISIGGIIWNKVPKTVGNVRVGDQLLSTTTPQLANLTNLCPARDGTSPATGMLGSVHVLGTGTGQLVFIDATTSDVTKRTGNLATTSIILAWYPNITSTSSIAFNLGFKRGLLVNYTGTIPATSTITYRCDI